MNTSECKISLCIIKLKSTVALSVETYFLRCCAKRIFLYCDDNNNNSNNNIQFRIWRVFKCFLHYCFRNDIFTKTISKYTELGTILKLNNGWKKFEDNCVHFNKGLLYFIIIIQKSSITSTY